jgi:two-component system sensor histidine kinase PilS (NtrC family)
MAEKEAWGPVPRLSPRLLCWYLAVRVVAISLFLAGAILYQVKSHSGQAWPVLGYLYLLVGISCLQALLSWILANRVQSLQWLAQGQLVWDLLFSALLIYLTGGIDSLFSSFFVLVILSSVLLLSRRDVLIVAAAAAILYGSLVDLQYYRLLPVLPGVRLAQEIAGPEAFFVLFVNVFAFLLSGLLGSLLVGRLRHSEHARHRMAIDYEELERLNRAILASMASGLLIIDRKLRIRMVNPAAENMLGSRFDELYNEKIAAFFPKLELLQDDRFQVIARGEGQLVDRTGRTRPIGFNTTRVTDPRHRIDGLLITFQDLTRLKEMEEHLKRTDRLAAVGRLAAGMAHEIRNPLASISGSVQLLRENLTLGREDRHLMDIVVREADRLSDLLNDFLLFARPTPPEKEELLAAELVDELVSLSTGDKRFDMVTFSDHCAPNVRLYGDRRQLRQALWNLVLNAVEAMPAGGELSLSVAEDGSTLCVTDSGTGVPQALRQKIFDPFFTTKDHGTGLGLAMTHSIIEAHGGTLELDSKVDCGARFVIRLPLADEAT